ncbi:MAG: hypothetical protein RL541_796 [Pseudomonadota bacterium]|jgi:hypothetical protein
MTAQRLMCIAWPAFLVTVLLEGLVFAVIDPLDLHFVAEGFQLSRQGFYTLAFFVFWGIIALASALSIFLLDTPKKSVQLNLQTDH